MTIATTTKKVTPKKTTAKLKRRSPISRAAGERRLVEAGILLVASAPFSEVGVREIAAQADVNHGFVHTWFGGKTPLFVAMATELAKQVAEDAANSPAGVVAIGPMNPKSILLIRLLTWLTLEGHTFEEGLPGNTTVKALENRFIALDGLEPAVAQSASIMAIGLAFSAVNFGKSLGISDDEIAEMLNLWRHIVGLLAKYPPQ